MLLHIRSFESVSIIDPLMAKKSGLHLLSFVELESESLKWDRGSAIITPTLKLKQLAPHWNVLTSA
jgi:hypothetical protein